MKFRSASRRLTAIALASMSAAAVSGGAAQAAPAFTHAEQTVKTVCIIDQPCDAADDGGRGPGNDGGDAEARCGVAFDCQDEPGARPPANGRPAPEPDDRERQPVHRPKPAPKPAPAPAPKPAPVSQPAPAAAPVAVTAPSPAPAAAAPPVINITLVAPPQQTAAPVQNAPAQTVPARKVIVVRHSSRPHRRHSHRHHRRG